MKKDSGKLPIKTKIAVWWIIAVLMTGTIAGAVLSLFSFINSCKSGPEGEGPCLIVVFVIGPYIIPIVGLLCSLPAIFIATKRKWAWIVAVTMLSIGCLIFIGFISMVFYPALVIPVFLLIYLVPLVLVALDFKKYWAMVEYRKAIKRTRTPADEVTSHPSGGL